MTALKFRSDISGLRAIAVLSVLLYHTGFNTGSQRLFPGGFIGVDIFFVISGYLITRIIIEDVINKNFSYAKFYERRIRRIAPALFVVMAFSVLASWLLMMPEQLKGFSASIISTIAFISNIYFLKQDGYFSEINEFKPLLHTWSLSVEEQFYLFFPPIVLLLFRFCSPEKIYRIFLCGLFISLISAEWIAIKMPAASFFLLPTRAWELLAGGTLALHEILYGRPLISKTSWKSLLPSIGFIFILIFILFVKESTTHIILYSVGPILGATLILWFGGNDICSRFLSRKILIWFGAISYSLYLWHQPILAFSRIWLGEVGSLEKIVLILITILLALVSYRYVEQPFRNRKSTSLRALLIFISVLLTTLVLFSFFVHKNNGYPTRFSGVIGASGFQDHENKIYQSIRMNCADMLFNCKKIDVANDNNWILIGDSYAGKMLPLSDELARRNIELIASVDLACPFLPGVKSYDNFVNGVACEEINDMRMDIIKKLNPSTIIYVARTTYFIEGHDFDANAPDGKGPKLNIKIVGHPDEEDVGPMIAAKFKETIEFLLKKGNRLILVYPIPEFNVYPPNEIVHQYTSSKTRLEFEKWQAEGGVHIDYELFKNRSARSYKAYDAISDSPNLLRIYPEKIFCNHIVLGQCNATYFNSIYYNDPGHLSSEGAALLNEMILIEAKKKWGNLVLN